MQQSSQVPYQVGTKQSFFFAKMY